MAYVHEIKFYFCSNNTLKVALYVKSAGQSTLSGELYDNPPLFGNEFWIKNIDASEMGFTRAPDGLKLEQKYKVEVLGIKPFHVSKTEFDFIDECVETAKHVAMQMATKIVS